MIKFKKPERFLSQEKLDEIWAGLQGRIDKINRNYRKEREYNHYGDSNWYKERQKSKD